MGRASNCAEIDFLQDRNLSPGAPPIYFGLAAVGAILRDSRPCPKSLACLSSRQVYLCLQATTQMELRQ
jgi:hypothetical protein